ncbi:MAG: hypothetical protein WCJ01_11560 [Ignavibacteria bacterium]
MKKQSDGGIYVSDCMMLTESLEFRTSRFYSPRLNLISKNVAKYAEEIEIDTKRESELTLLVYFSILRTPLDINFHQTAVNDKKVLQL